MIALGSDHAGRPLKLEIIRLLEEKGLAYTDFGTDSEKSCDYPVYGRIAAEAVADGRCERGILFCGTGIGMSITANKVPGIRAAVCHDAYSTERSRKSNNCQVMTMGARVIGEETAKMMVKIWLECEFQGGGSTAKVERIGAIEREFQK